MTHRCPKCDYSTIYKHNLTKHINRRHQKDAEKLLMPVTDPNKPWVCAKCSKGFSFQSGLSRHRKICKGASSEKPAAEYTNVVNVNIHGDHNKVGNIYQTNNHVTIQITPFSNTDPEITYNRFVSLMRGGASATILKMIQESHFNPDKPEGMNCYISNLKDKIGRVFEEDGWQVCEADDLTSQVLEKYKDCVDRMIEELREEEEEEADALKEKLGKMYDRLSMFVDRWERNTCKEEFDKHASRVVHLLLYNKKDLVRKQHDLRF